MNLFFRMIYVCLRAALSRERIGTLDPVRLKFRPFIGDRSKLGGLENSRYSSFCDLGTLNYFIRSGALSILRKRGWMPIIVSTTRIELLPSTQLNDFELETRIASWIGQHVNIIHVFHHNNQAFAEVSVVARVASTDKTQVTGDMIVAALGKTIASPLPTKLFQHQVETVKLLKSRFRMSKPAQ
ncbi:MAG: hypothetical protein L3J02_02050 [Henriciella sp.]|nr:hypothetical protein [Henriciella sp.]